MGSRTWRLVERVTSASLARAVGMAAALQLGAVTATVAVAAPAGTGGKGAAPPATCTGTFSGGGQINVANPVYLDDVPQTQIFCDFHTFAWNQFIYLVQMSPDPNNGGMVTPQFLHLAPWYNLLKPDGSKAPGPYPGGKTSLQTAGLDQAQAGTDDQLVDVAGATVLYDIRFNAAMYGSVVQQGLYTESTYRTSCAPDVAGNCQNALWMPPASPTTPPAPPAPGALEVKTSWRDFGTPKACPATTFYCNGRFGLTGMHLVQKTQSHGEWVWASFEHVANDPDCAPGSDTPIAPLSPLGTPWSFFNPQTAGPSVMSSKTCSVTATPPQCNGDPSPGASKTFVQVNICRTDAIPAGGASAANCLAVPDGPPQPKSNSPGNVACLNATFQPQMTGVWKNYKMIGSLWIRGTTSPTQLFTVQNFQQQEAGVKFGEPVGFPHLANTTMETWLQSGSTGYDPFQTNATQAGCFLCHQLPTSKGNKSTFSAALSSDDLSHYTNKLPTSRLKALLKTLLPATSTRKANR